jgi:hypothetical protein
MSSALRKSISFATIAAVAAWLFVACEKAPPLHRPLTVAELKGEWVQDPDFLQNAGEDLEAQKREIDGWENYEFAFADTRLTGWQLVHDEASRDASGWSQGKGMHFESDYTLAPAAKEVTLSFTDAEKAARQAKLAWDGDKLAVTIGDRKFRLKRAAAENLRTRKLVALP